MVPEHGSGGGGACWRVRHARHVTLACVYFGPSLEEARSDGRRDASGRAESRATTAAAQRLGGRAAEKRATAHMVQLCNNQCTTPHTPARADLGELPKSAEAPLHHSLVPSTRKIDTRAPQCAAGGQFAAENASDRLGRLNRAYFHTPFCVFFIIYLYFNTLHSIWYLPPTLRATCQMIKSSNVYSIFKIPIKLINYTIV